MSTLSERIHRMALDTNPEDFIALTSDETHRLGDEVKALERALQYCYDDKEVMQNVIDVHKANETKLRAQELVIETLENALTAAK